MPDEFKSIADLLNNDPGLEPVRKIIKQADVMLYFPEMFPDLKKLVKAVRVDKNILSLKVENSVLRSELKFKEVFIVSKINKHFKEERIKGIRFV